jgi:hypothetical protein
VERLFLYFFDITSLSCPCKKKFCTKRRAQSGGTFILDSTVQIDIGRVRSLMLLLSSLKMLVDVKSWNGKKDFVTINHTKAC